MKGGDNNLSLPGFNSSFWRFTGLWCGVGSTIDIIYLLPLIVEVVESKGVVVICNKQQFVLGGGSY